MVDVAGADGRTAIYNLTLFGGVRDQFSHRYGDLWSFDVAEKRWRTMDASNAPSARGGYYGMAYDPVLDEFVVAAGRPEHAVLLDETWHLKIRPDATGTATYVFDRAAFPTADRWFDVSTEPSGSRVRFRFAGSDDARRWGAWVPRPHLLEPRRARYVKVQIEMVPGPSGAAPRVSSMGFRTEAGSAAFATRARVMPIAPHHDGATGEPGAGAKP